MGVRFFSRGVVARGQETGVQVESTVILISQSNFETGHCGQAAGVGRVELAPPHREGAPCRGDGGRKGSEERLRRGRAAANAVV